MDHGLHKTGAAMAHSQATLVLALQAPAAAAAVAVVVAAVAVAVGMMLDAVVVGAAAAGCTMSPVADELDVVVGVVEVLVPSADAVLGMLAGASVWAVWSQPGQSV
jgi:hypothetical protein